MLSGSGRLGISFKYAAGAVSLALIGGPAPAKSPSADLIVWNGKVFTADSASHIVQAFAVRDGKFVDAGTSKSVLARNRGLHTTLVNLRGAFVTPGLADAHFHNEGGGPGIDL